MKKMLVMISLLILGTLVWGAGGGRVNIPFIGTSVPNLSPEETPKLSPVLSTNYSGILYKIEKRADGSAEFTVLVGKERTVKQFDAGPKVAAEAKSSGLKVGDGVLLTVQSRGVQQEAVDILSQDDPLLWTLAGKVVSFSEKKMVLNWYENEITVNMGKTVRLSFKYDKATNTPGQQTEIDDFSRMKVGDVVVVGISKVASSESLVINTVQVLN